MNIENLNRENSVVIESIEPEVKKIGPIPVLMIEGQEIESEQFKEIIKFTEYDEALRIYDTIKKLGENEYKNSKLRDKNGELLIVWHGSPRKFDTFRADAQGQFRWMNNGVHFSSSSELVTQYTKKALECREDFIRNLGVEIYKVKVNEQLNEVQLEKSITAYNEMIKDVIENGSSSHFYKTFSSDNKASLQDDCLIYGDSRFGLEWVLEIFGGEMPTEENTFFDGRMYIGNAIGQYKYAAILDIENPYVEDATDIDKAFKNGEESANKKGTDGTILIHSEDIQDIHGESIDGTKGTTTAGIFDINKIKLVGRVSQLGFFEKFEKLFV